MTDNQENKLRMYFTVSAVCENAIELWQDNEVFVSDFQKFRSKIPKIEKCRDQMNIESILEETLKSVDRVELEEMAFYLSGKIKTYAKHTENQPLLAEVKNYRDNLSDASDTELIGICNTLADIASTNLNQLLPSGLSVEDIANLQQLTSYFFVHINRAKSSHLKNKTNEEQLRKLFKDCDDLLRVRLDNDIEFYKNSDPEFYGQYKASRIVIGIEPTTLNEMKKMAGAIH